MAVLVDGIFGFPLHLPATIVLFWLALGLTVAVGLLKDEVNAQEIKMIRGNSNISRFKPLLYIGIILFTIFLCVTVTRPFAARIYWYYANGEIKNENWNEAIKIDEKALKWDPYLGEIYYDIGKILEIKELYGVAMEYFEKAEKYIDLPDLPQDFVLIYLKNGQLNKAAIKLKQAISYQRTDQDMLPLYCDLGSIYLQLKRHDLAEIALKKALQINPDYANAHFRLGGVYLEEKRPLEAQEEFQKVIELAPDSLEAKSAQEFVNKIIQEKAKKELEN
jgi:tetratricopeptide (TPR) repeat protein